MFKNIVTLITRKGNYFTQPTLNLKRCLTTFKPIAFYSIVPLSKKRVEILRNVLEKDLRSIGIVGRIYISPEEGIGGINCQMTVPIDKIDVMKNYFKSLNQDFGQIEYLEGIEDTTTPNFKKLRVLIKKNVNILHLVLQ